jgi:low affinity Fe/Cu permease
MATKQSNPTQANETRTAMKQQPTGARAWLGLTPKLPVPINPALAKHAEERATVTQNRIADTITRFAGSMTFVYIHVIWFACWIGFGVESYPYGLLTMIVSLEAIFLSTFVMISQNRADAKRQVIADAEWKTVREEDHQNRQLLDLSNQILTLTKAVHDYTRPAAGTDTTGASGTNGTASPGADSASSS